MAAAPRTSNRPKTQATIRVLIILVYTSQYPFVVCHGAGNGAMSGFTTNTREVQLKPITTRNVVCGGTVHQAAAVGAQTAPLWRLRAHGRGEGAPGCKRRANPDSYR